jgi:small Trp-rich protein
MPSIIALIIVILLKYFEVSFMEKISWWWIIGFAVLLFLWFDFFERIFGLNKQKGDMHHEKMKKERLKREFDTNRKK